MTGDLDTDELEVCDPVLGIAYMIITTLVLFYFLINIIFEIVLGAIGKSRDSSVLSRLKEAAEQEQGLKDHGYRPSADTINHDLQNLFMLREFLTSRQ